ncbi:MAG: glycosyltransferase family 2 protein [Zetaproteobacteria bacterium]|nr:MAG: glycosyltransferase family 2 protein [Zetaproteobacteria bacterium]
MKLSVVIPAFDEEARLPRTLEEATAWLDDRLEQGDLFDDYEIIVVDDGSRDRTAEVVEQLAGARSRLRLLRQPGNRGKGAAVRRGMIEANGDIRLFMDADHSTHIRELERGWPLLQQGAGVVIGSRQHAESEIARHQSWLRESMGKCFNAMMRGMTGIPLQDTQCGFKMFTAEAAALLFPQQRIDGFSFDVELIYLAQRAGIEVAEIPVRWVNEPHSRVRMLIDPLHMAADVVRIRLMHNKK